MKKDLVVKTNRLNQAFQVLSLAEFHIVQLAIVDARDTGTGLTTDMPLRIDALRYADVFGTTRQNAYIRMKEAEETLFNRRFSFFDEDGKLVKSRWISQVKYLDNEGAIEIVFTPAVVQGISRINGVKEFFTQYLLSQTAQLKSVYSSRLYELLIQWKSTGKTPIINLEDFRAQLGIEENQYKLMSDFKKRVLDLAINDINEKTDIKVTYQQHKKGRSISGFSFNFKQKKLANQSVEPRRDPNTLDIFSKMTDKQRHLFANKLSELPEMGRYSEGTESYQQFALRIADMLQDPTKFEELHPYLQKVGFKAA
ncbi:MULTISPECIES: replication initiation protein RepM [unclassified Acinetobacter]|uniref:replication initiation protein RepM n=1 Tax=unclassified Acinetobacter TaxID=196816 RepID=UPI0015D247C3|nr:MULTISPECIES: replication initiation protein RepM [unclassified Acinetobacter]